MNNTQSSANVQNMNTNSNPLNDSKNLISKKKDQSQQETLYNLCQALLRFINRKIVKKYIFPNEAQLPKEKRGLELRAKNDWKYYLNKDVTDEEKIKDVFKDDNFLKALQKMTNSLNEVTELIETNQEKMKNLEGKTKNKEDKINKLSEIKDILNQFFKQKEQIKEKDKDKEKGENPNNNKDENNNEITEDKVFDNVLEKIKDLCAYQKLDEDFSGNKNNTDNIVQDEEHSIKEERISFLNLSESPDKNKKINEKGINMITQSFKIEDLKDPEKTNNKSEKKEDIKNENIFLNKKTEREVKTKNNKSKNKKKKGQNKEKAENNDNDINNNIKDPKENNIELNELIANQNLFPILTPKEDNNNINNTTKDLKEKKKEEIIDEDIIKQLLENDEGENSKEKNKENNEKKLVEKKQVINIDLLTKNNNNKNNKKSPEDNFDSEIRKNFTRKRRPREDKSVEEIKSILHALENKKISKIKNYNERITGPYLAGSYKTFSDLQILDYPREIDLIFKYKDMLLNKEVIDHSIKEVLENYLKLSIIKNEEIKEDESIDKTVTKVYVECINNKGEKDIVIKFNIIFVDTKVNLNEQIIDELIINKKEFLVKAEEEKFMNICLFLRVWRRKNNLLYIIPELFDELARKYLTQNKSILTIILNVYYDLYNEIIEFSSKPDEYIPIQKKICQEIMINLYSKENNDLIKDLKQKILLITSSINDNDFEEIFKV